MDYSCACDCRYHLAQERKGRALNMYPPGRIIFLRPIKVRKKRKSGEEGKGKLVKKWDAVWVSPREVIGEGILVSKRVSSITHLDDPSSLPALEDICSAEDNCIGQVQPVSGRQVATKAYSFLFHWTLFCSLILLPAGCSTSSLIPPQNKTTPTPDLS